MHWWCKPSGGQRSSRCKTKRFKNKAKMQDSLCTSKETKVWENGAQKVKDKKHTKMQTRHRTQRCARQRCKSKVQEIGFDKLVKQKLKTLDSRKVQNKGGLHIRHIGREGTWQAALYMTKASRWKRMNRYRIQSSKRGCNKRCKTYECTYGWNAQDEGAKQVCLWLGRQ